MIFIIGLFTLFSSHAHAYWGCNAACVRHEYRGEDVCRGGKCYNTNVREIVDPNTEAGYGPTEKDARDNAKQAVLNQHCRFEAKVLSCDNNFEDPIPPPAPQEPIWKWYCTCYKENYSTSGDGLFHPYRESSSWTNMGTVSGNDMVEVHSECQSVSTTHTNSQTGATYRFGTAIIDVENCTVGH